MALPQQLSNSLSTSSISSNPALEDSFFNNSEYNQNESSSTILLTLEQALNNVQEYDEINNELVDFFIQEISQGLQIEFNQNLYKELNTWKLVKELVNSKFMFKYNKQDFEQDNLIEISKIKLNYRILEARLVDKFYSIDESFSELAAIRAWLENIAPCPSELPSHLPGMATCADALRKANDRFITKVQLDLDCEFRPNGTQLTNEAKQRDVLLSRAIFEHFRKGSIDDAIDVAIQYNEPWRVATFNGAKYLHYPLPNDYEQEFSGNFNRTQFKKRMEKLSSYPKFNPYERALYALLSGNLNQLIPICKTFEDYLWAMISCEIDKRVEFYIESKLSELENRQNRKSFNFMTLNQMLKQCKEFPTDPPYNPNNCFNIIQDFLIRGEFEQLFQYAKVALHSADANWNNPTLKRFFAHLYIYLTQNGIELDSTCLITYINELQSVPSRMVALYCSKLPLKDQTLAYSSFLIKLKKDKALRDEFIRYASGYGLSVKDIIMQTAELAMHHALGSLPDLLDDNLSIDEPLPTYDSSRTKKSDQLLVDSISWVVNNPSTYLESAQLANKIIRKFLIRGKLYQARQLIKAIPDTVREEWVSFQAREYFEDEQLMTSPDLIKLSIVEFAQHTQLVNCFRIIWRLRQSFKEDLTPDNDGFTDWKKELENLINNMELCFSEFSGTQYLNYPTSLEEDNINENEILRRLYIPELLIQIHSAYLLTSDIFHDNPQRSLEQLLPFYTAEQAGEHFELLNLTNRLKETTELIKLTSVKMLDLEGIKHRKPVQTPNYQEFRIRF